MGSAFFAARRTGTFRAIGAAGLCAVIGSCGRIGYEEFGLVPAESATSGGLVSGSSGGGGATSGGGVVEVDSGADVQDRSTGVGGVGGSSAMAGGGQGGSQDATSGGGAAPDTGGVDASRVVDSATADADSGTADAAPVAMYQIVGKQSAKCLDVPLSSLDNGAELVIANCTGGSNQLFTLRDRGGTFGVANVNSGKCLDLPSATDGTLLSQQPCTGAQNQAFRVQIAAESTIVDAESGLCVEALGSVSVAGTPVDGWTCNGGAHQTWTLSAVSTGACTPESDRAFCSRLGIACDQWTGSDNCGRTRTVVCGPCMALSQSCGRVTRNVCTDIGKVNLARGGTVSASTPGTAPMDMTKAFDENAGSRWFSAGAPTGWIAYQFAAAARNVVTSYSVTSAPDWPDTDPKNWTLEGSNGGAFAVLDTRANQVFLNRGQTNFYSFSNAAGYSRYRLNVSASNGSTQNLHLAEIQLFR